MRLVGRSGLTVSSWQTEVLDKNRHSDAAMPPAEKWHRFFWSLGSSWQQFGLCQPLWGTLFLLVHQLVTYSVCCLVASTYCSAPRDFWSFSSGNIRPAPAEQPWHESDYIETVWLQDAQLNNELTLTVRLQWSWNVLLKSAHVNLMVELEEKSEGFILWRTRIS